MNNRSTFRAAAAAFTALGLFSVCAGGCLRFGVPGGDVSALGAAQTEGATITGAETNGGGGTDAATDSTGATIDGDTDALTDGDTGAATVGDTDAAAENDPDAAEVPCTLDDFRCNENNVERCGFSAGATHWKLYQICPDGTCCTQGQCIRTASGGCDCPFENCNCPPNSYKCRGRSEVQQCSADGQSWTFYRDCADIGEICVNGECYEGVPADGDGEQDGETVDPHAVCVPEAGCPLEDEYCFVPDPAQTVGRCWRQCSLPGGDRCPRTHLCDRETGWCMPLVGYCTSDNNCTPEEFCDKFPPGSPDGVCRRYCNLPGSSCPVNTRCDDNIQSINYGKCVQDQDCLTCSYDGHCPVDEFCHLPLGQVQGCCQLRCTDMDWNCESGEVCCPGPLVCREDGRCGVGEHPADCGGACPTGYVCDELYNQCVLNCPPCDFNTCCDATTAGECSLNGPLCPQCVNPVICNMWFDQCCPGYNCTSLVYGQYGFCI